MSTMSWIDNSWRPGLQFASVEVNSSEGAAFIIKQSIYRQRLRARVWMKKIREI